MDDANCVVLSYTCVSKPITKVSDGQFVSQNDLFVETHLDMSHNPQAKSTKEILLVGIGKHLIPLPTSTTRVLRMDEKGPVLMWFVSSIILFGAVRIASDG